MASEKIEQPMPNESKKRLFNIKCRGKLGQYVSPEEHEFVVEMYNKYALQFEDMETDVFNATVPAGSNVKISRPKKYKA